MQIGRIYRTWRWHRCFITHDVYRERWCIGQHKTLSCDTWLFANIMLLKRSIKNESVQSNYFPRGGFINISTRWCTRARRERERERCKRARKSKERKLTMCPDRRMSSKPWLYVFLSCVCYRVCVMSCVDLLVTSLYQRGCLSKRVNLPGWQFFADNVST